MVDYMAKIVYNLVVCQFKSAFDMVTGGREI